jgi:spore germination cell wall hydrolase CwlJ-like protein
MDPLTAILIIIGVLLIANGGGGATVPVGSYSYGSGGYSSYGGPRQGGGNVTSGDAFVLAQTIYGEARGQSVAARQGVASVIMNRVHNGAYGASVTAVCKAPNQFHCWNAGDPNLAVIQRATVANAVFAACLQMAQSAVSGTLQDNTMGALRYHDTSISEPASWVRAGWRKTVQIGALIFYRQGGIT